MIANDREWLRGGDSLYRPGLPMEARDADRKIVLRGRTWTVRPEAD